MHITEKEIRDLAGLAQLDLTEEEQKRFAEELTTIVGYVEQLQKVDTTGVLPEGVVAPIEHRRRDEAHPGDAQQIMGSVPSTEGGAVKSPRILT